MEAESADEELTESVKDDGVQYMVLGMGALFFMSG